MTTTETTAAHDLEPTDGPLSFEELALTFRNRGMPLEALRHDLTPSGLHYLVVHFDIPVTDEATWTVDVGGAVGEPLRLSMADLRARPSRTIPVTLECAGNGRGRMTPRPLSIPWLEEAIGTAEWTGTPLAPILEEAGLADDAVEVVFRGTDRGIQGGEDQIYARSLTIDAATRPEVLLAYEMNGQPLQPQHGHPLRLIVPGWYGMTSVKWLTSIEAVTEPFEGYQQAVAYQYQTDEDDPGEPVSRIRVRALMAPPGVPDFYTRRRLVEAGTVPLLGRAWSGHGPVTKVEVRVDDGPWQEARLGDPVGDHAWRSWHHEWEAEPGDHELGCRATDATGAVQPTDTFWNYQGMGNNAVQRVPVTVV